MSQSSVFLFTGDNTYTLRLELNRWKRAFQLKHGLHNYAEYVGREMSVSLLLDTVSAMPFIAEKRLVVLEGLPKIDRDEFASVLREMHPDMILALIEPKPDKRLGIVKDLEKSCDVKTFSPLSPGELLQWMMQLAQSLGSSIDRPTATLLLDVLGDDQWILDSEIRKLALYVGPHPIQQEHIDLLAIPSGDQVIWKLTDLIGSGKVDSALQFLHHRLDRGEDPYGIWVILLNMLKNVVLVWAALDDGKSDERGIAAVTGLHFFAVRGLLTLARTFDVTRLRSLVDWAVSTDLALKTGGLHFSADHPHEIIAVTERLILRCR